MESTIDVEHLAKIFKALAHPTRIKILEHLITIDSCICNDIVNLFPFSQSTISQHLKLLKESGLVYGEIEGPATCYCVDKTVLNQLKTYTAQLGGE